MIRRKHKLHLAIKHGESFTKKETDFIAERVFSLMKRHSLKELRYEANLKTKEIVINSDMAKVVEKSALWTDIVQMVEVYHVEGVNARFASVRKKR